jgi:hypothetical protein
MAQRRMFSPDIVCSDAFLDMPASCRDLYYQLGMYADDDGFVNPRKIMRMIGSSEDDLKILIAKRFVLAFPSGVLVIKHWKINNLVRKDWYRPTQYIEEMGSLYTKENGAYTDMLPSEVKLVNESLTVRPRRLGKVRLGKVSIDTQSLSFLQPVPEVTLLEFSGKYFISTKGIQNKATDLLLYCEQKGKVYKNYKSFLENAIRKDKLKLQQEFPLSVVVEKEVPPELSEEQQEKNRQMRENIGKMLKTKQL